MVTRGTEQAVDEFPPTASAPSRRWLSFAVRVCIAGAILGLLLSQLDGAAVFSAMLGTGLLLWLVTVIAHVAAHALVALKWRNLLVATGLDVSQRDAIRAHLSGLFANTVVPSIIGGDAIRLGIVVRDGSRLSAAATAGLADRATDVIALIVLSLIGGLLIPVGFENLAVRILGYATALLLLAVVVGLVALRTLDAERLPGRLTKAVQGVQTALDAIAKKPGVVLRAQVAALLLQSFFILQNAWIGAAIGIEVPIAAWFIAWPLAKLIALTPVSIGGLGIREGALAALLLPFGVEATLAVAASLVWYSVMLALGLLGALIGVWLGRSGSPGTPAVTGTIGRQAAKKPTGSTEPSGRDESKQTRQTRQTMGTIPNGGAG